MPEKPTQAPVFFYPSSAAAETYWRPSVDVYRIPEGWLLKFDLAGVRLEDIHVQVQGCRISVSGVRRDWSVQEGCTYYSMEIAYSRFERTIELPCDLANPKITLEGRNGLLIVRVTKEGGESE